jgi:IS30 family transposase
MKRLPPANHPRGKPFQSKLAPHAQRIDHWLQSRVSFAKIVQALAEEAGVTVSVSTLFSWVRRRAKKPKRRYRIHEDFWQTPAPQLSVPPNFSLSAIERLKRKPSPPRQVKPLFEFDPEKPLTLNPKPQGEI